MNYLVIVSCSLLAMVANDVAHAQQYTTPVPILKQIDRHNDDGSYTYGYEAADKSFKIETKYPSGEVYGKYGYVDDVGKVREIEYGASKRGFEPQGSDINVPPPTLKSSNPYPLGPNEIDDGQYREDPSVYFKDQKYNRPIAASKFRLDSFQQPQQQQPAYNPTPQQPRYEPQPQYQPQPKYQPQPQYQSKPQPQYQPQPKYQPQPRYQPQPQYQQPYQRPFQQPYQQSYQQPRNTNVNVPTHHHPALSNLDIYSGSYSIDYTGRK